MAKQVKDFIKVLKDKGLLIDVKGESDSQVSFITYDSRKAKEGTLFVCKGAHFKSEYLVGAVKDGICAYMSEKEYDVNCPAIIVKDIRESMSALDLWFYGNLSEKINMIGITGTKGKSTVTYFTKYIFDEFLKEKDGTRIAFCSGISNYDGVIEEESHLTSPENMELFERIDRACNAGISYMVMEVSSQALKYNRVDGIEYQVACFNNIGEDHISPNEHKDFKDYFDSKLRIFKQAKKACINLDSDHIPEILDVAKTVPYVTYSLNNKEANFYAYDIKSDNGKISFRAVGQNLDGHDDFDEPIELASFGKINVINALAAIAIATSMKVPMKYIKSGLSKALTPGRMQVFRSSDGKKIGIVDYAHNKLSYEMLLSSISEEFPDRDIIMAVGTVGDKAFNRRKELGQEVSKYCKHVILTEADGGEEDVHSICEEIASYIGNGCSYEIIVDRPEAIRKLTTYANENTIVIAAGKAIEKFQKRGGYIVEIESDVEIMSKEI